MVAVTSINHIYREESMRKTKQCDKCNRDISLSNFKKHHNVCGNNKRKPKKYDYLRMDDGNYKCDICGKVYGPNGIGRHYWKNHTKEGQEFSITSWNKGKTTETHPELASSLSAGGKATGKLIKEGKIKSAFSEYMKTDEARKEQSKRKKELYKKHPEKHPNRKLAGNRNKMSFPEKLVFDFLTESDIVFEHNKRVGKYYPDFVIGTQIIEVDGERWHDEESDTTRDKELNKMGFEVERFQTKPIETLISRVKEFINR